MSNICLVTVGDMEEKFGIFLERLTDMELDALAYLCSTYKV